MTISPSLPAITFEMLCDWHGGMSARKTWNVPKKHIREFFPDVFQHWADSPPSGLMFEVAINYDGRQTYAWVVFV